MKKIVSILILLTIVLTGCSTDPAEDAVNGYLHDLKKGDIELCLARCSGSVSDSTFLYKALTYPKKSWDANSYGGYYNSYGKQFLQTIMKKWIKNYKIEKTESTTIDGNVVTDVSVLLDKLDINEDDFDVESSKWDSIKQKSLIAHQQEIQAAYDNGDEDTSLKLTWKYNAKDLFMAMQNSLLSKNEYKSQSITIELVTKAQESNYKIISLERN